MGQKSDRIALFLPSLAYGGAERIMVNLAHGFYRKGLTVDFVLGKAEGGYLCQIPKGVHIVDLNSSRILKSFPGLVKYLNKYRPKALISGLDHANIVSICAGFFSNSPSLIIATIHSSLPPVNNDVPIFSKKRFFPLLRKIFYRWADGIVAVSEEVGKKIFELIGIPEDRIEIIYNPVITDEIFKKSRENVVHPWFADNSSPLIISVGRLSEEKDHLLLLRAFQKIRKECSAKLAFIGDGGLRCFLEDIVTEFGLEKDVCFLGFVENPYKYIARSNLFVLSSKSEGLPTVLIEALALGVPVVSTDCPSGPREILMNGALGVLVPVGDMEALADAMLSNLTVKKAKPVVSGLERFQLETATEHYLNFIREKSHE